MVDLAQTGETGGSDRSGDEILRIGRLGVGSLGRKPAGWWGVLMLILTEGFLFAYLLFSYYFMALHYGRDWLPPELPSFRLSGPDTLILLLSSVAAWWGERSVQRNARWRGFLGIVLALVLGIVFVGIQLLEWADKPFGPSSNSYGSLYFVITGLHMAHVAAGLLILAALALWTALGAFDAERSASVSIGTIYWHFVDAVWLTIFFTIYVTPHLGL